MKRSLRVRKERLAELALVDLRGVAGANPLSDQVCVAATRLCPTYDCTGYYPTLNAPCDSVQPCIDTGR